MTIGNLKLAGPVIIALLTSVLLLLPVKILALEGHIPIRDYQVEHWDTGDGLPGSHVLSIAQTPDGYLWVTLPQGLVRYDGVRFVSVPPAVPGSTTALPAQLMMGQKNILWLGTSAGLMAYDYRTRHFGNHPGVKGVNGEQVRRIYQDRSGTIWTSFSTGNLARFSNGKLSTFGLKQGLLGQKVNVFLEDLEGNFYFGTRENGIFQYQDGTCSPYVIPALKERFLIVMHQDSTGDFWLGTQQGLLRHDGKNTWVYGKSDGLTSDFISAFWEDSDGTLWIGAIPGLNRVNRFPDGTLEFERFSLEVKIHSLYEDNERNLWVGSENKGLYRIRDSKFATCPSLTAHADEKYSAMAAGKDNCVWVGTLNGQVFCYRDDKISSTIRHKDLTGSIITALAEDKEGRLWIGTNGKGVFLYEKGRLTQWKSKDGLADNLVTSVCIDSLDRVWCCTFGGLSVFLPGGNLRSLGVNDNLAWSRSLNIVEDEMGDVWVATESGINLLKQGSIDSPRSLADFQDVHISGLNVELDPTREGGRILWISTQDAGLIRYRFPQGQKTTFSTKAGLPTNAIFQFFEDPGGFFWMLTDKGVLRVERSELNDYEPGQNRQVPSVLLDKSDGLASSEFDNQLSRHSVIKVDKDEYWLLTKEGIAILNPSKISISKTPPPVIIEEVQVDDLPIPWNPDGGIMGIKGTRDLKFRFTAPTFNSPQQVRFRYRLIGYEKNWNDLPLKNRRLVSYPSLSPGKYTFQVTAGKGDGNWNKKGASYSFTLLPYFYQTTVFKISFIILLLAAFLLGPRFYKRYKEGKKIKYRTSNVHPDFAENVLGKLKNLVEKEKIYRDENMSLDSLADKLNVPRHQLSQILNESLGQSFSDYINTLRIEEAKEILTSTRGKEIKKSSLAHEVGFNTMAAFYKAFKKYTGKTPTEFQKQKGGEKM